MARKKRRNPLTNEINWTPIVVIGGIALAAYVLYQKAVSSGSYRPPSCGGTAVGNFLCWASGGSIASAACTYVAATSCAPAVATGTVTLPNGQTVPVACGSARTCAQGGAIFSYQGTCYHLCSGGGPTGNYTANTMCQWQC